MKKIILHSLYLIILAISSILIFEFNQSKKISLKNIFSKNIQVENHDYMIGPNGEKIVLRKKGIKIGEEIEYKSSSNPNHFTNTNLKIKALTRKGPKAIILTEKDNKVQLRGFLKLTTERGEITETEYYSSHGDNKTESFLF